MLKLSILVLLYCGLVIIYCQERTGMEVEKYISLLKDKNPDVRKSAAIELSKMEIKSKEVLPLLVNVFNDKEFAVKLYVLHTLTKMGNEIVPFLLDTMKNKNNAVDVRAWTVATLASMEDQPVSVIPDFVYILQCQENEGDISELKASIVWALGAKKAYCSIPTLIALLKRDDKMQVALPPFLIRFCDTSKPFLSWYIIDALGKMCPESLPELVGLLRHRNPMIREWTADVLGKSIPKVLEEKKNINLESIVQALVKTLQDQDESTRRATLKSLQEIGSYNSFSTLFIYQHIIDGLGEVLPESISQYMFFSQHRNSMVRAWTAKALGNDTRKLLMKNGYINLNIVLQILFKAIEDQDKNTRIAAATSLAEIGSYIMSQKNLMAVKSLEETETFASISLPILMNALQDQDKEVRQAAEKAIKTITGKDDITKQK